MKKNIISALIIFGITVTLIFILGRENTTSGPSKGELMIKEVQK